jgi:hypothetical protein
VVERMVGMLALWSEDETGRSERIVMGCVEQVPSVEARRGLISLETDCSPRTSPILQVSKTV